MSNAPEEDDRTILSAAGNDTSATPGSAPRIDDDGDGQALPAGTLIGEFELRAKIGEGLAANTVFVARRPTGELYTPQLGEQFPGRDWILTRILWLSGREPGRNRLGSVDTMRRYVYIHGSPDSAAMGAPGSHGCIRMRNADIVDLFDRVPVYTPVEITED